MKFFLLIATLSLGAQAFAGTQERDPIGSFSRARAVFDRIDANSDESLSREETEATGIPAEHFDEHDGNADLCMSRNEFSVYYYYLLITAAQGVEADLADEVARLRALHLARLAASKTPARPAPRTQQPPREELPTAAESLERARALLLELTQEGTLSKQAARDFKPFFWGKEGATLDPIEAGATFARASGSVDELLASGALGQKQARLLRSTLERQAGPAAVRIASQPQIDSASEPSDLASEPLETSEGPREPARGSVGIELPPVALEVTVPTEGGLIGPVWAPPLESTEAPAETKDGAESTESTSPPSPTSTTGSASKGASSGTSTKSTTGPSSTRTPGATGNSGNTGNSGRIEGPEGPVVAPWVPPVRPFDVLAPPEGDMTAEIPVDRTGAATRPETQPRVRESVGLGLPSVQLQVDGDEPASSPAPAPAAVELPFFVPSSPPAMPATEASAPGSRSTGPRTPGAPAGAAAPKASAGLDRGAGSTAG